MKMKAKTVTIKAGSIITYSEYSFWKKLCSLVTNKRLYHNKFKLILEDTELTLMQNKNINLFTAIRPYNNKELFKLKIVASQPIVKWEDLYAVINIVRSNTLEGTDGPEALVNCRFYKRIDLNVEKLDEYIY